jgi:hypothetical protein
VRIADLTPDEKAQLCDWAASLFGGYGRSVSCTDGTSASSKSSQAACVADAIPPGCEATVADEEACGRKVHDFCGSALDMPECAPLLPCTTPAAQAFAPSSAAAVPPRTLTVGIRLR